MSRKIDMVWVTKEGKRMAIAEMEDRHLLDSIRLLERKCAELKLKLKLPDNCPVPRIATLAFPVYENMVKEMESRLRRPNSKPPQLGITTGKRRIVIIE